MAENDQVDQAQEDDLLDDDPNYTPEGERTGAEPAAKREPLAGESAPSRVALVTGGAGGIPLELAIGLARAGADVCLWGRGTNHPMPEAAARARAELGPASASRVESLTVDTGDSGACEAAISKVRIAAPDSSL